MATEDDAGGVFIVVTNTNVFLFFFIVATDTKENKTQHNILYVCIQLIHILIVYQFLFYFTCLVYSIHTYMQTKLSNKSEIKKKVSNLELQFILHSPHKEARYQFSVK